MKNSVILQFDNDPKHRSLKAFEFYKENSIKTIDWPSNSLDLNPIENIWVKKTSYVDKSLITSTSKEKSNNGMGQSNKEKSADLFE